MKISNSNYNKIQRLYLFCLLYVAHRDFDLARKIAKNNPLSYKQAERLANFCNQVVKTRKVEPHEFMQNEDENSNDVIEKYIALKDCIKQIKSILGAKEKDLLYKSVKAFYRKKAFGYQMDSFYIAVIHGLYRYSNGMISFDWFVKDYCFEISLFDGKIKPINVRYAIKMTNYILRC